MRTIFATFRINESCLCFLFQYDVKDKKIMLFLITSILVMMRCTCLICRSHISALNIQRTLRQKNTSIALLNELFSFSLLMIMKIVFSILCFINYIYSWNFSTTWRCYCCFHARRKSILLPQDFIYLNS